MQRTTLTLLALAVLLVSPMQGQSMLNPLNWFDGSEKDIIAMKTASPADEAAAAKMLEDGKARLGAGSTGAANRIFKRMIKNYPNAKATAEARFLHGQILMTSGRWVKAFDAYQELLQTHPGYENFDRVIGAQFECATALMEGARGRILWILPGFRQYSKAIQQFEQIVRNAPYNDYAPLALMNMAIVAEQQNRPEDALDALDRLINYYPQSMLASDAYFNMAETYANLVKGADYDQGSTRQAISYYEDFLILFPQSSSIGEAEANLQSMENLLASSRLNLGDFYYNYRANNTAALVFYNETITIAPESESAAEARLRIADIEAGVRPTSGATILRKLLLAD
ncbi:MAG: outer membrane protein assembly factor BamD [Puniceicoccaceae bacterium]|nr:MAG: outer membrane protein assembly factor BamD [Puniceicoccaceae bacterium]